MSEIIHIKNMVCHRCVMAVANILKQLDIGYEEAQVGEVKLAEIPGEEKLKQLKESLESASELKGRRNCSYMKI